MKDQIQEEYMDNHPQNEKCLFKDWEGFLNRLYESGGKVKAFLFYECKDRTCEQTRFMMNGLEEDDLTSVKQKVRLILAEQVGRELYPRFFLYNKNLPDLRKYDGRCVRLTDVFGDTYEGNAVYFSDEYAWQEFGCYEEGLQFVCYIFYYDQIRSIEILDDHEGPYGRFSAPFGKLEEDCIGDPDLIDEFFCSQENEHIGRMLKCLEVYLDPQNGKEMDEREKTLDLIRKFVKTTDDEVLCDQAKQILKAEEERKT